MQNISLEKINILLRKWTLAKGVEEIKLHWYGRLLSLTIRRREHEDRREIRLVIRNSWVIQLSSEASDSKSLEDKFADSKVEQHCESKQFLTLCKILDWGAINKAEIIENGHLLLTVDNQTLCIEGNATDDDDFDIPCWQIFSGSHTLCSSEGVLCGNWDPNELRHLEKNPTKPVLAFFNYTAYCWKEKSSKTLPRIQIYRDIFSEDGCEEVEFLPIAEIEKTIRSRFKGVWKSGQILAWHWQGALHQIELGSQYFSYGLHLEEDATQGASFEICSIPQLAGEFGCTVYFPQTDSSLEKPILSTVRQITALRAGLEAQKSGIEAVQLPARIIGNDKTLLTEHAAVLDCSTSELEEVTGLVFEDDIDGLDTYKLAFLQIADDRYL